MIVSPLSDKYLGPIVLENSAQTTADWFTVNKGQRALLKT
jgi:hypothetical protein